VAVAAIFALIVRQVVTPTASPQAADRYQGHHAGRNSGGRVWRQSELALTFAFALNARMVAEQL
jgi:hypothetical protein